MSYGYAIAAGIGEGLLGMSKLWMSGILEDRLLQKRAELERQSAEHLARLKMQLDSEDRATRAKQFNTKTQELVDQRIVAKHAALMEPLDRAPDIPPQERPILRNQMLQQAEGERGKLMADPMLQAQAAMQTGNYDMVPALAAMANAEREANKPIVSGFGSVVHSADGKTVLYDGTAQVRAATAQQAAAARQAGVDADLRKEIRDYVADTTPNAPFADPVEGKPQKDIALMQLRQQLLLRAASAAGPEFDLAQADSDIQPTLMLFQQVMAAEATKQATEAFKTKQIDTNRFPSPQALALAIYNSKLTVDVFGKWVREQAAQGNKPGARDPMEDVAKMKDKPSYQWPTDVDYGQPNYGGGILSQELGF